MDQFLKLRAADALHKNNDMDTPKAKEKPHRKHDDSHVDYDFVACQEPDGHLATSCVHVPEGLSCETIYFHIECNTVIYS